MDLGLDLPAAYPPPWQWQWLLSHWLSQTAEPYVEDARLDADIPPAQRRTLPELSSHTCRWPVGDPCHRDFFYCGAQPAPQQPYCPAHCARAYRRARGANPGQPRQASPQCPGSTAPPDPAIRSEISTVAGGEK